VSYKLVDQILRTEMPELSAPEKWVLTYMARHAHDDGSQVFCGAATIARMTKLGQRTVERAIAGLRRKGYLVESGWRAATHNLLKIHNHRTAAARA
jgi:hypothetical protein